MNRPFGAVDVSANLKGAVPKTATQKILVALAEKKEVVQKSYGKTTFFVANQANLGELPAEKLSALETEYKAIEEENTALAAEVKVASAELAKLKSTPTDAELATLIDEVAAAVRIQSYRHLEPLRSGTPLVSAAEIAQLDADWVKWRMEWVRRRKIFKDFWDLATDALPRQDATNLAEDLGIEYDADEHAVLERNSLCTSLGANGKAKK
ncbi:TBPIP-domain-containing protein [Gloeophyllum trabeum ATCC 11539]|uniref:TBPIP-domain-containing protein n=1 Tax=Gloeophyllum trabeum (strain ATCC 11539 / FP-39264 / Madison 617) TaxID=670483 RepID=S7Q0B0_GLOTA|nr:TBPIP-domain-containing protein [Gloeophyllum trabeum ATCC 11539]EPQ52957.1 TBPIP-domain-containing protein [Gloeophyllum trabeum ATCC 11539]